MMLFFIVLLMWRLVEVVMLFLMVRLVFSMEKVELVMLWLVVVGFVGVLENILCSF